MPFSTGAYTLAEKDAPFKWEQVEVRRQRRRPLPRFETTSFEAAVLIRTTLHDYSSSRTPNLTRFLSRSRHVVSATPTSRSRSVPGAARGAQNGPLKADIRVLTSRSERSLHLSLPSLDMKVLVSL